MAVEPHESQGAPAPRPARANRAGGGLRSRVAAAFSGSRDLVRIVYRDPEHVSERLTVFAAQRLGPPSAAWAEQVREARAGVAPATIAADLRSQSAQIARIDGAVAGTPFFLALVPGYLSYLWQEARMTLRTAALYGRDPGSSETSAEMLVLRGVHPTVEAAHQALVTIPAGLPPKPTGRRSLVTWVRSIRSLLVFGGFLAPRTAKQRAGSHARLRAAAGLLVGVAIWIVTWVLPVTFMIAMAWGCETHARQLGLRTVALYDGEAATARDAITVASGLHDRGHDRRRAMRVVALGLSVAIPIAFVAYANHVRQSTGVNWLGALGALVALSLVIAAAIVGSRR